MKKLSTKAKISYGFGDFGSCLMTGMISYYLSFYCTVFLKMPFMAVGTILLVVQIWDAVNDIIIGNLVDYTRTKEGRAKPWIKWFMIPCCLSGALVFACPVSLPMTAKILWVGVSYFIFVLFFTCVSIPYLSLFSLMTKDSDERATLSTTRYVGAYTGILIVACGALPMVNLVLLFKNKAWLIVLLIVLVYWFRFPFYGSTMTYYYRFYLGIDETASSIMYTAGTIGGIIVLPFVSKFVSKWDYKKPLIGGCLVSCLAMLAGFLSSKNVTLSVIFFTINYAAETFPCAITVMMLADSLEYGELKFGKKITGLGFAANNFASKAGSALGGFVVSMVYSMTHLNTEAAIAAQPPMAIGTIRILFWGVPAILSFVMILLTLKYPLDKKIYNEMMAELEERNNSTTKGVH